MNGDEYWRARVGIVLQSWRDHGPWGVRELLDHFGRYIEPYREPYDTDKLIEAVGLSDHTHKKVSALSGGQRRRLDVAIGLVGKPEVLFLDEPTAGFDPHARREFHELIQRLSKFDDTTILLTTHDLTEAEKLADRILILSGGRISADGSAKQLSEQVSNHAEVGWTLHGERFTRATENATKFLLKLFHEHGEAVTNLEVRQTTLEDTYLAITAQESTHQGGPEKRLEK